MHVPLDAPESAFSFLKKTDASGEEGREARPLAGSRRTRQHCRGYAVSEVHNFLGARYFQSTAGLHQRELNYDDGQESEERQRPIPRGSMPRHSTNSTVLGNCNADAGKRHEQKCKDEKYAQDFEARPGTRRVKRLLSEQTLEEMRQRTAVAESVNGCRGHMQIIARYCATSGCTVLQLVHTICRCVDFCVYQFRSF